MDCKQNENYTTAMVCQLCGGMGHVQSDCRLKNDPEALKALKEKDAKTDSFYDSLMADIGTQQSKPGESAAPWKLDAGMWAYY
jgi:hypothetical protein